MDPSRSQKPKIFYLFIYFFLLDVGETDNISMDHVRTNAYLFLGEKKKKDLFIIISYSFLKDILRKANASEFASPESNLVNHYMFD